MTMQNLSCSAAVKYYEELRSIEIRKERHERSDLGLTLFLHKGMVSWVDICHQYIPQTYLDDTDNSFNNDKGSDKNLQMESELKDSLVSIIANIVRQNIGDVLCHQI